MNKGYLIDLAFLNKFQKLSDWIQGYLGWNNFAVAKFLRILMWISLLMREFVSFRDGIDSMEVVIIICSITVIMKMEFMAHKAERSLKNKNGLMNPAVNQYANARIIMQFVALAAFGFLIIHLYYIFSPSLTAVEKPYHDWKELLWDIFGVLIFPVSYFSSCTPKPYNPRKERKLVPLTLKKASLR